MKESPGDISLQGFFRAVSPQTHIYTIPDGTVV
jgi:hypothetical protein